MAETRHGDVALFVAGALDPAEDAAFAGHLAECAACRDEIVWMSELTAAVGRVDDPRPSIMDIREKNRPNAWIAAAAAAGLLAAGGGIGYLAGHETSPDPAQALFDTGATHHAGNPASQVSADVAVVPDRAGTEIGLRLSDPVGPKTCELVVVGRDGVRQTAMSWQVPAGGFGHDDSAPLMARGAAGMPADQITRFEIRSDNAVLLTIPV